MTPEENEINACLDKVFDYKKVDRKPMNFSSLDECR